MQTCVFVRHKLWNYLCIGVGIKCDTFFLEGSFNVLIIFYYSVVYNKKLFLRLGRGVYVVNPDLDIQIADGEWLNPYAMMNVEKMTRDRNEELKTEALRILTDLRQAALLKWQKQQDAERRRLENERWERFGNWDR